MVPILAAAALMLPTHAGAATHRVVKQGGHPVVGLVQSAGPVHGVRVSIHDGRGRLVTHAPTRSNRRGVFVLRLHRALPRTFTVSTAGGRDDRGRVYGSLRSGYTSYRRAEPVVVNNATTLAAAYRSKYPRMRQAAVERRIKRFLALPADVDLRTSLTVSDTRFHGPTFTRAAKQNVGRYSAQLVPIIARGHRKSYRRPIASGARARSADVVKADIPFTNTQLINGTTNIVSKLPEFGGVAAPLVGLIMGATLGFEEDPTAIQLRQIEAKLDAVQQSLSYSIGTQHDAAMRADYNAFSVAIDASVLPSIEAASHTAWILYTAAVKEGLDDGARTPGTAAAREAQVASDTFLACYNDANGGMSSAGNTLIDGMGQLAVIMNRTGGAQGDSPLVLWKRAVSDDRFISKADQQRYFTAWEYWRTLHAHLLINVDYATTEQGRAKRPFMGVWIDQFARRGNPGNATEAPALANWRINAGLDQIFQYLTNGQVYDRGTNSIWETGDDCCSPERATWSSGSTRRSSHPSPCPPRRRSKPVRFPARWHARQGRHRILVRGAVPDRQRLPPERLRGDLWSKSDGLQGTLLIDDPTTVPDFTASPRVNRCFMPVYVPAPGKLPAPVRD